MFPPLMTAKTACRNNGDLTFAQESEEWRMTEVELSHGACLADLDGDGHPDIAVARSDAPNMVYFAGR